RKGFYSLFKTLQQNHISNEDGGEIAFEGLEDGDYLLMETKALPGYQLPSGYWIISVNNSEELPVDKIAIQGYGTHAPPAFYRDSRSALHLPNFNQYTLPAAGGKGMIASIILGIMVMGCGVLYYLHPKTRRKSSQSN
ncbi:prealbumin-like fold domain-containing protein, partial [Enterococcus lactis]